MPLPETPASAINRARILGSQKLWMWSAITWAARAGSRRWNCAAISFARRT
jgi:hypothetical protein